MSTSSQHQQNTQTDNKKSGLGLGLGFTPENAKPKTYKQNLKAVLTAYVVCFKQRPFVTLMLTVLVASLIVMTFFRTANGILYLIYKSL